MLHVLVGEEASVEPLQKAAAQRGTAPWIVPKAATPGDKAVLFFPHAGFLGHGEIASRPKSTVFGRRPTYGAEIGSIALFRSPIALDAVAKRFPEWAWVRYPRSFTTPAPELGEEILAYILENLQDGPKSVPPSGHLGAVPISAAEIIEGRRLLKLHKIKERKPKIVRRKKKAVLAATGRLVCEACDFDFASVYGKLGEGFAECHHRSPIAGSDGKAPTRLEDLAIVCSNCHRMLHRSRPMLKVQDLRLLIFQRRSDR